MNYKKIDIESWDRKAQFEFFRNLDSPFFNITSNIEIGKLKDFCKNQNIPFSLGILHTILLSLNSQKIYRLRVVDEELLEYEKIHVGTTIPYKETSFLYCFLEYFEDIKEFAENAKKSISECIEKGEFYPNSRPDVVYFTSIPWVSYTHISHAKSFNKTDFIPRIAVGKYFEENGVLKMPLSIEVHHALSDGYHVGWLFNTIQDRVFGL